MHIVLLGDSIFDNGVYVNPGEPDVRAQLEALLPADARATLLAVDGATTMHMPAQMERVPADSSHLILSVGGNNALGNLHMLEEPANSTAEVLMKLAAVQDTFESQYRGVVSSLKTRKLPSGLCTIYYPRFPEATIQQIAVTALTIFNDSIIRIAVENGLPLLDLRLILDDDADYANPIEPAAKGGEKIAAAILRLVQEHDFSLQRTQVYA